MARSKTRDRSSLAIWRFAIWPSRSLRWPFWVSSAIAALLMVLTVVSCFWFIIFVYTRQLPPPPPNPRMFFHSYTQRAIGAEAYAGIAYLYFDSNELARPDGWEVRFYNDPALPYWQFGYADRALAIPLYLLAAPFVISSTVMFVRSRRALPGHCTKCGYDLAGLKSGTCPECGQEKTE